MLSFSSGYQMLSATEGQTTQPLISAGKTAVSPGCAMAIRTTPVWNDSNDERLLSVVAENGRKWKLVSRRVEDVAEIEYKNR
jgi:hypothetical protein